MRPSSEVPAEQTIDTRAAGVGWRCYKEFDLSPNVWDPWCPSSEVAIGS